MRFEIGQEYKRSAIHDQYAGSRQSGISRSAKFPFVFLFMYGTAEKHGYSDGFKEDGTLWYTGEGRSGDMPWNRSNVAIRDSDSNGTELHVFEQSPRKGFVRYLGSASYISHQRSLAHDGEGGERSIIVFELALNVQDSKQDYPSAEIQQAKEAPQRSLSLEQLYALSLQKIPKESTAKERRVIVRERSEAVKRYVLRRASGICEGCGNPAPFIKKDGSAYLEPHHLFRLSDGGPDHPDKVVALCPNCHRRVHSGADGQEFNAKLIQKFQCTEEAVIAD